MYGKTTFEYELESLAGELIGRYPAGFLGKVEVVWPYTIAIQVPNGSCLDTLWAIIQCPSQKIRAFKIACRRAKEACIQFIFPVIAPAKVAEAI